MQAAVWEPVGLGLVQGHQVFEVHAQYRQPEACAVRPGAAVTGIVVVGSKELRQLQQGLWGRGVLCRGKDVMGEAISAPLATRVSSGPLGGGGPVAFCTAP